MEEKWIPPLLLLGALIGCSDTATKNYEPVAGPPAGQNTLGATRCIKCHEKEYANWVQTAHADGRLMREGSTGQPQQCAVCHDNLESHLVHPNRNKPQDIDAMTKSAQNRLCGACHFDENRVGHNVINPQLDHGLFSSAGFEGKAHELSCLDCHDGHGDHDHMLESSQANLCFKCHKSAILTMGVFQPVNYLAGGKLCTACHPPHGATKAGHAGRMTVGVAAVCAPCHL
jgi:predicted CXXCH cytochrome family protein